MNTLSGCPFSHGKVANYGKENKQRWANQVNVQDLACKTVPFAVQANRIETQDCQPKIIPYASNDAMPYAA